jgi:two-component system, cell cycle response regulator DivK
VRTDAPLVLLVDDEPDQVEMYQLALELSGFRVVSAYTGTEGFAQAQRARPAVIVLDLRLPDLSGWDVCARLRSDPATERIPVIILTAAAAPTVGEQAAAAGCKAHLTKPCFPDRLIQTIREVIGTPEQA